MSIFQKVLLKLFLNKKICPFCGKVYSSDSMLCPKCTSKLQAANKKEFCRKCGKFIVNNSVENNALSTKDFLENKAEGFCKSCFDKEYYFDIARGVTTYEGIVKDNMYNLKYHGQRSLAVIMAKLMVDKALTFSEFWNVDCIVPIPISKEKLVVRRYNQSYLLAKEISRIFKKPIINNNLIRVVNTPAQSKLTKFAREENLYNAFEVLNSKDFINKRILLVDDILTTGTTVNECSRVLKEKGASAVLVLTLVTGRTTWNGGKIYGYSEL